MTMTEDRATALLDQPRLDRAAGAAQHRHDPAAESRPPSPRRWSDPDEALMRWWLLGLFLLGLYAAGFVMFGMWLTP